MGFRPTERRARAQIQAEDVSFPASPPPCSKAARMWRCEGRDATRRAPHSSLNLHVCSALCAFRHIRGKLADRTRWPRPEAVEPAISLTAKMAQDLARPFAPETRG